MTSLSLSCPVTAETEKGVGRGCPGRDPAGKESWEGRSMLPRELGRGARPSGQPGASGQW